MQEDKSTKDNIRQLIINTERPYKVLLGKNILKETGKFISEIHPAGKIAILSEESIFHRYGADVMESLSYAGFQVHKIFIPGGEESKDVRFLSRIWETLALEEFSRSDLLLSLGGGVVGDLTGFAAATYLRGVPFIQVPTTLLSAADASVGGKTAINLSAGKNLAGAFWQPSLVIFDVQVIKSLPLSCMQDGLAEVIKCAVIADPLLFNDLSSASFPLSSEEALHFISSAVSIKADLVEKDERDWGARQLLNFGHTLGHAIEKCSNYKISHGHAVAMGMYFFARASQSILPGSKDCARPLEKILKQYGFPLEIHFTPKELEKSILRDKKRKGDLITLVLPETIGSCKLVDLPLSRLSSFIQKAIGTFPDENN